MSAPFCIYMLLLGNIGCDHPAPHPVGVFESLDSMCERDEHSIPARMVARYAISAAESRVRTRIMKREIHRSPHFTVHAMATVCEIVGTSIHPRLSHKCCTNKSSPSALRTVAAASCVPPVPHISNRTAYCVLIIVPPD